MRRLTLLIVSILPDLLAQPPAPKVQDKVKDRFVPAAYSQQKLEGYLAGRMRVNLEGRLLNIQEEELLAGFRQRPGSHAWIGEHIGKYLDAAANTWEYTRDDRLLTQMRRMALDLIKTQRPDGYLGTYTDDQRWTSWDVWVHKYDLIGLLAYYRISGDERALNAVRKVGDLLANTFGDDQGPQGSAKKDIIAASTHVGMAATSVLEPVCQLYRLTGEKRFLDFAWYITRAWEQPDGPKLLSALLSHGNVFKTANGKAYEMMSDLVGALELYRLTGEPRLLEAARRAQDDIVKRRRYLTGTTSTHEHFQDDFALPAEMVNDVGEGCATVTWLQLNWHLLRLTGEPRYAEELERTVFNQLLAAQDAANGNICYFTAMNGRKVTRDNINCCRSSEPRGISMIPALVWGSMAGSIAVEMYAPGQATIDGVTIRQQTEFPASGRVVITVNPPGPRQFELLLRVPVWAENFTARIGKDIVHGQPGAYLKIARAWRPGDTVAVNVDLPLQVHDGGESYPGRIALQRGPQVLALERSLNPDVPFLFRAGLKSDPPKRAGENAFAGAAFDGTRLIDATLKFVPFADAKEYRIWLSAPGKVSTAPVAVTAFGNESFSSRGEDRHGSICDERTDAWRTSRGPRQGAQPPATTWWAVELPKPALIRRVVIAAGEITPEGGWFDTSAGKPRIEIQRVAGGAWETVATFDAYPDTTSAAVPTIRPGQTFEVVLKQPVEAVAVRVSGKPGRNYSSLAELAAY